MCVSCDVTCVSFTCLTRDSVGKMRDFNDESNFNNFVATNDERRFFTQHRYPVSFFIEKNCLCLLVKRTMMRVVHKKIVFNKVPFSHIKHEVKYVKVY